MNFSQTDLTIRFSGGEFCWLQILSSGRQTSLLLHGREALMDLKNKFWRPSTQTVCRRTGAPGARGSYRLRSPALLWTEEDLEQNEHMQSLMLWVLCVLIGVSGAGHSVLMVK